MAALLLLTLRGTPFIYMGEELGLPNTIVPEDRLQDPARLYGPGRDGERTPMQWTRDGGFTSGEPWLPYGDLSLNVESESRDPSSMLSLYKRLIAFRRKSGALTYGAYAPIDDTPEGIFSYTRTHGNERLLIALNFLDRENTFELPEGMHAGEMIVGTHDDPPAGQRLTLQPNEGRLLKLS